MTAETEPQRQQREAAFRQRMQRDGDLGLLLCQQLWNGYVDIRLADEEFEIVGCDEVPGYEDENFAVLLRRQSDGQVFEADIEVTIVPVREPAQADDWNYAAAARLTGVVTEVKP